MTDKILTASAEPAVIKSISIVSNKTQEAVDISSGTTLLMYFESILQDTIRATVRFVDSGDSTKEGKTVREGLPLVGQERVEIEFIDNNEVSIGKSPKLTLYVNKITPVDSDTKTELIQLELVSKEFILNEKIRVNSRYSGKINDHIEDILKNNEEYLQTEKELDIEEVENNFNFVGNNKKPFFMVNALSKKSIPAGKKGEAAGYFFYETSDGYYFKSLDTLLDPSKNPKKKSIIYNETPESKGVNLPAGYDMKALEYNLDNRVNVQEKLKQGAYDSKMILFDPFTCFYEVVISKADEKDTEQSAGKGLPVLNKEFDRVNKGNEKNFSRTTYFLVDKGSLPSGDTSSQIDECETENFEYIQITNQAIRRYNQFYSSKVTITIPGDFSLHVGDAIFVDAPGLNADKSGEKDQQAGGIYIIADLCHYMTPDNTYTKINLVRDTFGRKGTAS
ncbi:MAG: hypothetical protein CMP62_06125 [Flavobacteriales bacterium]|nr:hypothetical protein [Flavobacteriales bacterium]